MKLSRFAREFYELQIDTSTNTGIPVLPSEWEASFDGGRNWVTATVVTHDTENWAAWLVAGQNADRGDAVAVITATKLYPLVRLIDNPEVVVRDAPAIIVV